MKWMKWIKKNEWKEKWITRKMHEMKKERMHANEWTMNEYKPEWKIKRIK